MIFLLNANSYFKPYNNVYFIRITWEYLIVYNCANK